jgi:hypothetical protein
MKILLRALSLAGAACVLVLAFAPFAEALARVGGGQSYGGGGGSGGGGGGGGGDAEGLFYLIYLIVRFLIWLTIEYPAVGIPVDIVVILGVGYFFLRRKQSA